MLQKLRLVKRPFRYRPRQCVTLFDLPENSLLIIPVSIMTKIPMKRTDDPTIHMKQILRPFSSSQVKKDWIFKHTSSGFIPLNGFGTAWQNCKLGLWMYQLWRKPASLSSHFSQWHSKLRMVKVSISPTGLEVHLKHIFWTKKVFVQYPSWAEKSGTPIFTPPNLLAVSKTCWAIYFQQFDIKWSSLDIINYFKPIIKILSFKFLIRGLPVYALPF